MTELPSTDEVLSELREFQRSTARHAFRRLYDKEHPSLRFLVADEVGLGKTLVARGVIAQVVEHLRAIGDRRVDIVYICSNGAIARQNLRKLNIAGDDAITQADRFTLLANEIGRLEKRPINIIAVTPGTSLEFGQSSGTFRERALLYAILQKAWGVEAMKGAGPERVFHLGITDNRSARQRLRAKAEEARPSRSVVSAFKKQLREVNEFRRIDGRPTLKVEFNHLAKAFAYQDSYTRRDRDERNRFIVELRRALATVGIEALQPDLVILDEFQRFRTLLDPTNPSWAARLARELFDYEEPKTKRPTRTLLLSATPYRPYTTADDASDDDHFEDFVHTARFLLHDEAATDALRYDLASLRRALMVIDRDGGVSAEAACTRITQCLQPVMARTERLASTPDRSGMLGRVDVPMVLEQSDVEGYLAIARTAEILGHRDVIEFWKSGPYLLNFMERYALKRALDETVEGGPAPAGLADLVSNAQGLLNWKDVKRYGEIDPANARLRALLKDTVGRGIWNLLWLPPALPYYEGGGIFEDEVARTYTKRLVFSAWHLVPKVISAVVSYQAERAMFDAIGELDAQSYDDYRKRSDRLLDFRTQNNRPEAMANLLTVVPFVELARLTDPLALSRELRSGDRPPSLVEVQRVARERVTEAMAGLLRGAPKTGVVDQRWYWAAPLLLDLTADQESARHWWEREIASTWTHEESEDGSRFEQHLDLAWEFVREGARQPLGRVPVDLVEVLVAYGLGSPAAAALRSVHRVADVPLSWDEDLLAAAVRIAWGFRSLFNGPDATAVVRSATEHDVYWRAVLDYGVMGNLQAVVDEYLHVLKEWRGFLSPRREEFAGDLAETAYSALTLRTVSYAADIPRARSGGIVVDRHTMRGRFAIRFGDQSIEGEQRQQRAEQASHAFNSPFWPFVLSTTSIGQEGLDFHLYSHAVVHWNLPSNPVDFEQREGRVHRYKGHAIRKNVASACGSAAFADGSGDPWVRMFDAAAAISDSSDGELSPYWVFSPEGSPAKIERHVPVLPLSRDASKLDRLVKGVATYRLSFGQPRQEELVEYLAGRLSEEELAAMVDRLKVDLSPPVSGPAKS